MTKEGANDAWVRGMFLRTLDLVCVTTNSKPVILMNRSDGQRDNFLQSMVIYLVKDMTGASNCEIARATGKNVSAVRRAIQYFERDIKLKWARALFESVLDEDSLDDFYYRVLKRIRNEALDQHCDRENPDRNSSLESNRCS
jgi:hypothetical protein